MASSVQTCPWQHTHMTASVVSVVSMVTPVSVMSVVFECLATFPGFKAVGVVSTTVLIKLSKQQNLIIANIKQCAYLARHLEGFT